jgi:SdrD B-like domain
MSFHARNARRDARPRPARRIAATRLEQLEARLVLSTFAVINTDDSGAGSLRQAILDANDNAGADEIGFNIPGPGVHTIEPLTSLPATSAVTIDGTTQPGFATGGPRLIELSGINYEYNTYPEFGNDYGLRLRSDSTVRGLAINRFYFGILVDGGANNHIEGNYVGTDATGAQPCPNENGVYLNGSANLVGTNDDGINDEAERNVISGNQIGVVMVDPLNVVAGNYIGTDPTGMHAVSDPGGPLQHVGILSGGNQGRIIGNLVSGNDVGVQPDQPNVVIQGNLFGTDRTGDAALPNGIGIFCQFGSGPTLVGGATPEARNIITGNDIGIRIQAAIGLTIQGNSIGRSLSGADLGGGLGIYQQGGSALIGGRTPGEGNVISGNSCGIDFSGLSNEVNRVEGNSIVNNRVGVGLVDGTVNQVIGGTDAGAGNTIAFNGTGVLVGRNSPFYSTQNRIVGNSIFGNQGLGIDLSDHLGGDDPDGVTLDDPLDADTGSNGQQNFPVLTTAGAGTTSNVIGTLNSTPGASFRIELFASPTGDPSGYGQGQRYLGFTNVTTDSNGNAAINASALGASAIGEAITATATALTGPKANCTSEFSAWINAVQLPTASISGLVFSDFNDDGQVDFGESGIGGVTIALNGTDFLGNPVHGTYATGSDGTYVFNGLLQGHYTINETQPAGYTQGKNSIGTGGGAVSDDQFDVYLAASLNAMNYNYGEQPAATGSIKKGQTAGIGFWNNKNGQALIKALNGGVGTQLSDWLAATLPHMFGASAGSDNLSGKSNSAVASFFQSRFVIKDQKLDAQLLATAIAVYVTDGTLDSTYVGTQYGFLVGGNGVATATYNVGATGAAFGVANNSVVTVMDILLAADAQAVNGVLYNGNTTKRNQANSVFSAINEAGGL